MNATPSPRIPLHVEVEFRKSYARQPSKAVLKNISLSGAFLELSDLDVLPGDKVALTFKVSGRERKIQATVVWKNELGGGLKFKHSNNRDLQIVDDLMYFVENKRDDSRGLFDSILKKVS